MAIVGGLRHRLIFDSIYNMINDSLTSLGWFDAGREHLPIRFVSEPIDPDEEVDYNTLALSADNTSGSEWELGSNYSEHTRDYYVDFYAEGHALGEHLIYDVRDVIEGRMPSIGRTYPGTAVYDYRTQPAPPQICTVEFDFIFVDRANQFVKPWQRHWWSISFRVIDYYGDEND
jgi:hypothetical protein